ncbi:MAG: Gfo/Idh/MocA family oxidoreductase [Actinomycetota bacterium]
MRVGVVGIGYWGSKHVRVLHNVEEVSQVVAIDGDEGRRSSIAAVFPTAGTAASLTEALDQIDAVVIATPPVSHADLALEAIEAGKHVMVEKPLATNSSDARKMIQAAEDQGVTLMVGHTFEYNAAVVRLQELVQSGALGDIHYIDSARLNLGLYQHDVNVLWDLAPHDISICNYVLGEFPTSVSAWGAAHAHNQFEDVASIRLDYGTIGVSATIRVSWLDPNKVRTTTVVGSKQMAVYNDLLDNERLKLYDRGVSVDDGADDHAMPTSYRYGDIVAPHVDFPEPLLTEARDFVTSAIEGRTPRASGANGLAVVETLEAADIALKEHQSVPIRMSSEAAGR